MAEKVKILVVDDELPVCKSIASTLSDEAYSVDTALSGEEALEHDERKHYDLIIVDLMMPGISGIDLLKKINEKRPETMFIMVTGYPSIRTAVEAIKLGAFDYLPKPFTPNDLRSIVSRALMRRRVIEQRPAETRVLEEMTMPQGLHVIPENTWAKVEDDGNVLVGIHHMLLLTIKKIASIEFPKLNETRYQGEACIRIIDANQQVHRLWSPVTGKIIAINQEIRDDYSKLYREPYGKGWLLLITPTNLKNDLKNLAVS